VRQRPVDVVDSDETDTYRLARLSFVFKANQVDGWTEPTLSRRR
jgi:hypothetical protein